jgi:hypothetical protein
MIDKGFIETFGPSGVVFNVLGQSKNMTSSQTGHLFNYALVMMVFLVAIFVALASHWSLRVQRRLSIPFWFFFLMLHLLLASVLIN